MSNYVLLVSGQCLDGVWMVSGQCIEGCLDNVLTTHRRSLNKPWNVYIRPRIIAPKCLDSNWMLTGWCLDIVCMVSGQYLDFARGSSGVWTQHIFGWNFELNQSVSRCCLNSVWIMYGQCLNCGQKVFLQSTFLGKFFLDTSIFWKYISKHLFITQHF